MKSIERRFDDYEKKRPNVSTILNFAAAVKGGKFSNDRIRRWFTRLVDKDDYCSSEKRDILKHLYELSNPLRRTTSDPNSSISGASEASDEA